MSATTSLSIVVVGGGIGGLSAGIALRRAGHSVRVLERSSFTSEVGAAITVPPNASRVLRSWGLDFAAARMVPYRGIQVVRADVDPMKVIVHRDQTFIENSFNSPYLLSHRVDLHNALKSMAVGDGPGIPVEIVTNAAVVSYDARAGAVTLADGFELAADLVVAADGVHSRANKFVLGNERPALPSATTVIRFMIPTEAVLADPKTAPLLAGIAAEGSQISIYTAADNTRLLVRYPCRNDELQNFGAYSDNDNEDAAVEEWNIKSNRTSLLRRLQGFAPAVIEVCQKTNEILPLWKCADREPLPKLHLGRLVLIGDAAHPMLPHLGQGASQAIEDAAVLGILCSDLHDVSDIPQRLDLFDLARRERVAAAQVLSTVPVSVASTEAVQSRCQEYFPEGEVPKTQREAHAFFWRHDCILETLKMLKEHLAEGISSKPVIGSQLL